MEHAGEGNNTRQVAAPEEVAQPDSSLIRRAVAAATVGTFVEYYDFTVYATLAPVFATTFFPGVNPTTALLSAFAVFAVAFFVRPFASLVWGPLGDRIGRQRVLVIIITLMALATFAVGLIPSYATIGLLAPILLVILRVLQGFSAGGEQAGAAIFVAEYSPEGRRGLLVGWIQFAITLSVLVGVVVITLLTSIIAEEAMSTWGWRIPFLLAAPLGFIGLYIRLQLQDTPRFRAIERAGERARTPLRDVFGVGEIYKQIAIAGFLGMSAYVGFYLLLAYMPSFLIEVVSFSLSEALLLLTISLGLTTAAVPFMGVLSDRLGRRAMLIGSSIAFLLLSYPCFLLLGQGGFVSATLGLVLLAIPNAACIATQLVAALERFPTRIRYTALAFTVATFLAFFGGTVPYASTSLISATGSSSAPSFFLMAAALISLITALIMTETAKSPLQDY